MFLPTITEPVYPVEKARYEPGIRYAWTGPERQVIRERYVREGLAACMALLPARGRGSIMNEAARMELRRQKPHAPPRESNEMLDAAIRRLYAEGGAVAAFAKRWGVTRQWVSVRAAEIGARRTLAPWSEWTQAELDLLELHATKKAASIANILKRHGFIRAPAAVNDKLRKLDIDRLDMDNLSANETARCMGVDAHVALRWISHHGLKASRQGTGRTDHWSIKRKDLRAWMLRCRAWDHRKVDRDFLVEILSGDSAARVKAA